MKSAVRIIHILLIMLVLSFCRPQARAAVPAPAPDPEYLIFQLGTENKSYDTLLPELKAEFGARPAGSPRYIGWAVALMTFTTPLEDLRRQVARALDETEKTGLPLLIKLDDCNFLPEFSDPSMVEWTAFPQPGEAVGPRAKHYWLNWGNWMALPPPPNFQSPAIRQEVARRLNDGVLPPLLERLARWKEQNRSHLFAGIVVGWETGIPDYRPLRNAPVAPRDEQRKITMTPEEEGEQLGYASLYVRGWTQPRVEARARETGQSVEDVTTELLFPVIHDYTAFWAKTVNDAGIPRERIYTHGVAWESVPESSLPGAWMRKSSRVPPIWVNVNPYSRPGYTVGAGQFEMEGLRRRMKAAGATDGWGGVEAYVRGVESEAAFGDYLQQFFANGVRLLDIFGWTAPGSPYDPKRATGALRAAHAWLDGQELPAAAPPAAQQPPPGMAPGSMPPSLQAKMERLQMLAEQRRQAGGDMQPIVAIAEGIGPLVEQQKFREAEVLADRALKLLNEPSAPEAPAPPQQAIGVTPGVMPASLPAKMQRLHALVEQRQQEGADLQPVGELMQGFQPLLQQQKFAEAEALLDRALKLLRQMPATPKAAATEAGPPSHLQTEVLVAPYLSTYKESPPSFKGITDAMDLLVENGMNAYMFALKWKGLEPEPGKFSLQEHFINPLTLLVPRYPQLKGVILVLQMIDTNWRPMPADLSAKPFDDPAVVQRFDALIDAMVAQPCSKRLTHILLGNEVDGYLGQHPEEGAPFLTFFKHEVERIHQRLPGIKVGTIFTAQGATRGSRRLFDEINQYSDFVDFTYYPVEGLVRGNSSATWQMLPIEDSLAELARLVERAGNKPFSFTEIGYSASPLNHSSEDKQAEFVRGMFRVLDPYREKGQIAFILYHAMYDYPPGVCAPYAKQQGVPPELICGFMENLGLRSYLTGAPRQAWGALVEGVKRWNH